MKWLLLFLLLVPTVSALQVSIPNQTIDLTRGSLNSITVRLRNNDTFDISHVTLDATLPDTVFGSIDVIPAGQEAVFLLNVTPSSSYFQTFFRKFLYDQPRPVILSPLLREVNITGGGFRPNPLNMTDGDTVRWFNRDNITHTVSSSLFDNQLFPNNTFQFIVNGIQTLNYFDKVTNLGGSLLILNKTQFVLTHVLDQDVPITLSFNSIAIDSFIEASFIEPTGGNTTLLTNQKFDGLLQLKNPSNNNAKNVTLSGSFFTFDKNNLNITVNQQVFVPFSFKKDFNESNQSFTFFIEYRGENVRSGTLGFRVFVPSSAGSQVDNSTAEFFRQKLEFCRAFPTSPFCITAPVLQERNVTVYQDKEVPYTFTAESINQYFRQQAEMSETLRVSLNFMKEKVDKFDLQNTQMVNQTGLIAGKVVEIDALNFENQRKIKNMYVFGTVIVILGVAIIAGFYIVKHIGRPGEVGLT